MNTKQLQHHTLLVTLVALGALLGILTARLLIVDRAPPSPDHLLAIQHHTVAAQDVLYELFLPYSNPLEVPIKISNIRGGCECLRSIGHEIFVPPKGSSSIPVQLDLRGKRGTLELFFYGDISIGEQLATKRIIATVQVTILGEPAVHLLWVETDSMLLPNTPIEFLFIVNPTCVPELQSPQSYRLENASNTSAELIVLEAASPHPEYQGWNCYRGLINVRTLLDSLTFSTTLILDSSEAAIEIPIAIRHSYSSGVFLSPRQALDAEKLIVDAILVSPNSSSSEPDFAGRSATAISKTLDSWLLPLRSPEHWPSLMVASYGDRQLLFDCPELLQYTEVDPTAGPTGSVTHIHGGRIANEVPNSSHSD